MKDKGKCSAGMREDGMTRQALQANVSLSPYRIRDLESPLGAPAGVKRVPRYVASVPWYK